MIGSRPGRAVVIMPYRAEGQDEGEVRRAAQGLPPRKTKTQKSTLLKNGDYKANVYVRLAMIAMELPSSFEMKLGLQRGTLVTLQMEGIQIEGMVVDGFAPPPALMKTYKERESGAVWFAMLKSIGGKLLSNLTKQPTGNFGLVEGESTVAKLRIQKNDCEGVDQPQKPLKAKDSPDAVMIPKKVGKPGPKIAALIPKIDRCFSWTQVCLFELRGKQMVGAVYAAPAIVSTEQPAEIMATIAPFKGERVGKETNKSFRRYPDGVGRAFAWIASHAKGGYLWTTHFDVNLDFFGRRTRVSGKEVLPASIAAWREIFGIEIDSTSKDKTKPRKKK